MEKRLNQAMRSRNDRRHRRGAGGFTLFELVVVMGIVGILTAIALPAMHRFVQNQQASSAASALITDLNYARSEAIKEDLSIAGGVGVSLCASTGAGANPTCDTGNWLSGWIVLSPANAAPLQWVGVLPTGLTLTTTPANASIVFQPNGTAPALTVGANGRVMFKLCDNRGATSAREVEVSANGIIQASPNPGLDVAGVALTCP
jgi:type IV fimbrial biogenesis protein FimT